MEQRTGVAPVQTEPAMASVQTGHDTEACQAAKDTLGRRGRGGGQGEVTWWGKWAAMKVLEKNMRSCMTPNTDQPGGRKYKTKERSRRFKNRK